MTELAKHSFPQAEAWQSLLGAFTRDVKILCDEELVNDLENEVKVGWGGSVAHMLHTTECKAHYTGKASAEPMMHQRTLPYMAFYAIEWVIASLLRAINELHWVPKQTAGFGAESIWSHPQYNEVLFNKSSSLILSSLMFSCWSIRNRNIDATTDVLNSKSKHQTTRWYTPLHKKVWAPYFWNYFGTWRKYKIITCKLAKNLTRIHC